MMGDGDLATAEAPAAPRGRPGSRRPPEDILGSPA